MSWDLTQRRQETGHPKFKLSSASHSLLECLVVEVEDARYLPCSIFSFSFARGEWAAVRCASCGRLWLCRFPGRGGWRRCRLLRLGGRTGHFAGLLRRGLARELSRGRLGGGLRGRRERSRGVRG